MDSSGESRESHVAYFDIVRLEGQKPATEGIMTPLFSHWGKIYIKARTFVWMKLNCWNVSYFGSYAAFTRELNLLVYFACMTMNICVNAYSKAKHYLFALGTYNESGSINGIANNATGEVFTSVNQSKDGRGSIVVHPFLCTKGSKYFKADSSALKSYSTSSRKRNTKAEVSQLPTLSKGYENLAKLWFRSFQNPKVVFKDLGYFLKLDEVWFVAYLKLKANKGSFTRGPDNETLNDLTKTRILELKSAVLAGRYEWTGTRRIEIPKLGKPGKFRPLGIPAINDRLVQEVIRSILEPLFEAQFSGHSHGFRPGRSCHTALKELRTQMKDSIWFIEGDIKSYFDTINHEVLMSLIAKRVQDKIVLKLIRTGLKARIFTKDIAKHQSSYIPELGSPQGGILSSLLSNIYLHELDLFLEQLSAKYLGSVTPLQRRKNPLYRSLMKKGLKNQVYNLGIPSRDPFQKEYRRVKYIRYADDFLVGVLGPRSLAIQVRNEIQNFLKEYLYIDLNVDKTHITHISNKVSFLGYLFGLYTVFTRQVYSGKEVARRMTVPRITIDLKKVISKLALLGICDGSGNPKPLFRYLRYPQIETNVRINRILNGLSNWWSIAHNRKQAVAFAAYLFRYSIAKMYAAKFHLHTVAAVFKLGRNDLSKSIGVKLKSVVGVGNTTRDKNIPGILFDRYHKIPAPLSDTAVKNWMADHEKILRTTRLKDFMIFLQKEGLRSNDSNPIVRRLGWRLDRGLSHGGTPCSLCGTLDTVQMHHTKPLQTVKDKSSLNLSKVGFSIQQIPLCRKCHLKVH